MICDAAQTDLSHSFGGFPVPLSLVQTLLEKPGLSIENTCSRVSRVMKYSLHAGMYSTVTASVPPG